MKNKQIKLFTNENFEFIILFDKISQFFSSVTDQLQTHISLID